MRVEKVPNVGPIPKIRPVQNKYGESSTNKKRENSLENRHKTFCETLRAELNKQTKNSSLENSVQEKKKDEEQRSFDERI